MGWYREQFLPRVIDKACGTESMARWRARAMDGLAGVVVEPGFGSGTNVAHYPPEVTKIYAVDPAVVGQELASDRLAASTIPVEFIGLDGHSIPLDDNSCDAALLTFTLCTMAQPTTALAELRRVTKPGGALHFVEHGLAPHKRMATWQRRIDPAQKLLFDGCHLSRDHPSLLTDAGFEIDWIDAQYADAKSPWTYFHIGRAINP